MFTVCPKCALTLVVTAADLRVAQGYVRCGRCSSVFNALARLSEEQGPAVGGESAAAPTPRPAAATTAQPAEGHTDLSPLEEALTRPEQAEAPEEAPEEVPEEAAEEPIPEGALEFNPETTDVGSVFIEPPPDPQWTAATGSFRAMKAASKEPRAAEPPSSAPEESQVDVEIDAAFLASMLREPAAAEPEPPPSEPPQPQRSAPAPAAPPPARPPAPRHAAPHVRPPAAASARPAAAHPQAAPQAAAHPPPQARAAPERDTRAFQVHQEALAASLDLGADATTATEDIEDTGNRRLPVRLSPQLWGAGAALALLILLAQIVNHHRDELAASASFNGPLAALYRFFGVQLAPQWDVRAYDVRQLGAKADPAGSGIITLRASVKNAARQPQPLPLLRVTLQDRFGNRIAARDVAPRFYVPHTMPDSSYLASGQRIDAEMGFVDPGANAVGFEIDACLPASGGGVTCANDLAAR
jgi:predicted Zn finger-like uncharacterized protein